MNEIKKLIVFFLKNSTRELGRTEIMKYLYLFEYYYFQLFGKQFTDLKFERYKFGPNDALVVEATIEMEKEGIIKIDEYTNYYNSTSYDHHLIKDSEQYFLESANAEFVACYVSDLLKNQNYRGILNIAYATPPMKELLAEENSTDTQLYGRVVDMSKTEPIFKTSRQERQKALKMLKKNDQARGTDEEYYSHLIDQYNKFEDTRRRATDAGADLP